MLTGSFWILTARSGSNVLALFSTIILARLLTPADFGLVALATAFITVVAAVTEMSLSSALVHGEPDDSHFATAWTLNLMRGLLLGTIVILAGFPMAMFYEDDRLRAVMAVLGVSMMIAGLLNPKLVTFQKNLSFRQDALVMVAGRAISFITVVAVGYIYRSYWAIVAGTVAQQVTSIILSYALLPYLPHFQLSKWREMISFSIWLTFGTALNSLNSKLDQLLLGNTLGSTTLGYYVVGDNLSSVPTREAVAPIAQMLFPAFTGIRNDLDRLRGVYTRAQTTISAIAFPVSAGFALVAEPLILLAMGPKWLPSVIVIQLLSAIMGLQTISTAARPLALALGATKNQFQRELTFISLRLPMIIIGIWAGGLMGLLYARMIAGFVSMFINMRMVQMLIGISKLDQVRANVVGLVATAAMAAAVLLFRFFVPFGHDTGGLIATIATSIVIGALSYIGVRALIWLVAGKPDGPEREFVNALNSARAAAGRLFAR